MATVSDQIRKLQMKGSAEQRARAVREARREKRRLEAKAAGAQTGIRIDAGFERQLQRKATEAKERLGQQPRGDLPEVIEKLRLEGKLPPAPDDANKVGYEPTPEEILGSDETLVPPVPVPASADPVPDAEAVLNAAPAGGLTDFTEEELDEIARMNPPATGKKPSGKQTLPRNKRK